MAETKELRAHQKYKKRSSLGMVWHQLKKNKGAIIGLVLILLVIILALCAPLIYDYKTDIVKNHVRERMLFPSREHPFGTDDLGRDILARVIWGARYSLAVGVVAVMFALVVGVTLGAIAGYVGGVFEDIVMRICDIFSSIPSVLLAIAVVSAMGKSTINLMIAVGLASSAPFTRVARAAVLVVRDEEYVEAARAIGMRELCLADHRPGNAACRLCHHLRRSAELPRIGSTCSGSGMGLDAFHRPAVYSRLQLYDTVPRVGDHALRIVPEPAW